ncbi:MAG TPA: YidC/Oxa1 family membrane protein insertase [Candidatus Dojkabacteria bacterium]|nr:YidC/Oxa1 family membrane protein insertase [Candidatus Dojkabacteria bacterium]
MFGFLGTIWNTILFYPFLNTLVILYHILGNNLGWAVIVLAVAIRLALIPSGKSQLEMTQKMTAIKPQLDKVQKQYANNQEKLVEAQMRIYKESGYNPLGCVSSLIPQLLILYVMIEVINVVTRNSFSGIYEPVKQWIFGNVAISDIRLDTTFYFIDLSKTATSLGYTLAGLPYYALALLVGLTQYLSTVFLQKFQQGNTTITKKNRKPGEAMDPMEMQTQMLGSMNIIFPIMTAFISISAPAVLGVYWFVQSLMLVAQYFILDWNKSKEIILSYFKRN